MGNCRFKAIHLNADWKYFHVTDECASSFFVAQLVSPKLHEALDNVKINSQRSGVTIPESYFVGGQHDFTTLARLPVSAVSIVEEKADGGETVHGFSFILLSFHLSFVLTL